MKSPHLQLLFAHIDEPVPSAFLNYRKPTLRENSSLNTRQIQKWKARRLAHFLLHRLCEQYHIDNQWLQQIPKTANGRPYLSHPNIDFNISHSGEWIAIIFAMHNPKIAVGIDIEHPQKTRPYHRLLTHYASENEINEINQHHVLPQLTNLTQRFYLSWCLREAVLKAQGIGIIKLSEVEHQLTQQQINTSHCPRGKLFFYHQLPFFLACFIEQHPSLLAPSIFQWKNEKFVPINHLNPLIYQVN